MEHEYFDRLSLGDTDALGCWLSKRNAFRHDGAFMCATVQMHYKFNEIVTRSLNIVVYAFLMRCALIKIKSNNAHDER